MIQLNFKIKSFSNIRFKIGKYSKIEYKHNLKDTSFLLSNNNNLSTIYMY